MGIDEVLLVGGAAGVGKSAAGWEMSVQLNRLGISHWHLEGDVLDAAWPRTADDLHGSRLSQRVLAAMGAVFADEGYTRCVFVQTYSLMDIDLVRRALGPVCLRGALLTATEETRIARLRGREVGSDLARHIDGGARMADHLDRELPAWVHRFPTDGLPVADVAASLINITGWPKPWPASSLAANGVRGSHSHTAVACGLLQSGR